jgi:hypothetical protein
LAIQQVLREIAVAPHHPMVALEQLVQLRPQHQRQILVLVAEVLVIQEVLMWSAETAPAELLYLDTQCQQLQSQHQLVV